MTPGELFWACLFTVTLFLGSWGCRSQYRMGLLDGWNAHKHQSDSLYDKHRKIIKEYGQ